MLIVANKLQFYVPKEKKRLRPGDTGTDIPLRAVLLSYHSDENRPKPRSFQSVWKMCFFSPSAAADTLKWKSEPTGLSGCQLNLIKPKL